MCTKKKRKERAEKEEEEDKLEIFFCKIHEFHNPVTVAPVFVPAELPPRYAINFVPADIPLFPRASSVVPSPVTPVTSFLTVVPDVPASPVIVSSYSVVSSANFVVPSPSPSYCMPTT